MPELPEVETMVRDLATRVSGRRIREATVHWDRIVGHPDANSFVEGVEGRLIQQVSRRGKFAIFDLDDGSTLAVHRGMTGSLLLRRSIEPDDRFVRARLRLDDGSELRLDDARKFGRLFWTGPEANGWQRPWTRLGPEPLSDDFNPGVLKERLAARRVAIKTALLNQTVIAGIGNIYADETLFLARVHPRRPANQLSPVEIERLYDSMRSVLRDAIDGRGTTFSTYRDVNGRSGNHQQRLLVFGREPDPCVRCGTAIERIVVGARGTHLCIRCQV